MKHIPQRMCIGCRKMLDKGTLMRLVKTADGEIALDEKQKVLSRAWYICKNEECIKLAKKKHVLERVMHSRSENVYEMLIEHI